VIKVSAELIVAILVLATIVDSAYTFGRYMAKRQIKQLERENQMLRDLLNKTMCMEKLTSQTYSKIVREFTAANAQKPMHKPKSSP